MAYKSMVVDAFFADLILALRDVELVHGQFALAMLTSSFSDTRGWDLQVSARWLDQMSSSRTARKKLRAALECKLGTNRSELEFIHIRNREDYMVQTLVPLFDVPSLNTAYAFSSKEQKLFEFEDVIVLVARPALLLQPELKLSA